MKCEIFDMWNVGYRMLARMWDVDLKNALKPKLQNSGIRVTCFRKIDSTMYTSPQISFIFKLSCSKGINKAVNAKQGHISNFTKFFTIYLNYFSSNLNKAKSKNDRVAILRLKTSLVNALFSADDLLIRKPRR